MRIIITAIILCALLCSLPAAARAQSVQTDFDKSYNFSGLKTFGFAVQRRRLSDPLAQDPLNDGRIRAALEANLTAAGFKPESGGGADFAVAYYVSTRNAFSVQEYGYGPPRWFGGRDIRVDQYTEGTLTVDIIDARTKQLVWRGRASGTVELKGADKKVSKAVEKLVKKFLKDTRGKA
jgi:hypothetical protein